MVPLCVFFFVTHNPVFLNSSRTHRGRPAQETGAPGPTTYRLREGLVVGCPLVLRVVCRCETPPLWGCVLKGFPLRLLICT